MRRRLLAVLMAACVLAAGCGVNAGMEKVDDAKHVKKQAEKQAHDLKKDLKRAQEN